MKNLIRRISGAADSYRYTLLRSDSSSAVVRRRSSAVPVRQGHIPVYVGEEMERFAVSAKLLNHPVFVTLLEKSAQEYGYEQKGVIRIPCHVLVFERVLEAIRVGHHDSRDLHDVLSSP